MTTKPKENFDVIIIGGGLAGLSAAYTCQQFGFEPVILEKQSSLGGGNQTVINENGDCFDKGFHVLDFGRSALATKFFQKMLDHKFVKFKLKRGVIMQDSVFDYNAPAEKWPLNIQKLFIKKEFIDDIQSFDQIEKIETIYGKEFVNFVIEEALKSYPHKRWSLKNGAKIRDHFDMVYPWFFPYASRMVERKSEWEFYHDKMRTTEHYSMYPSEGGFQSFVNGIVDHLKRNPFHCELSCSDLEFNFKSERYIESVRAKGINYKAPLILWCAPLSELFRFFNMPLNIKGTRQRIILGNFTFDSKVNTNYHEILVGSQSHLMNRMSFPGSMNGKNDNLIQVEFSFPDGEYNQTEQEWKQIWLQSLTKLGLISKPECKDFAFMSEVRGFATELPFSTILADIKNELAQVKTNIELPFPMIGVENINRVVPETITNVVKFLNTKGMML